MQSVHVYMRMLTINRGGIFPIAQTPSYAPMHLLPTLVHYAIYDALYTLKLLNSQ